MTRYIKTNQLMDGNEDHLDSRRLILIYSYRVSHNSLRDLVDYKNNMAKYTTIKLMLFDRVYSKVLLCI